jgi:hypothetical protein
MSGLKVGVLMSDCCTVNTLPTHGTHTSYTCSCYDRGCYGQLHQQLVELEGAVLQAPISVSGFARVDGHVTHAWPVGNIRGKHPSRFDSPVRLHLLPDWFPGLLLVVDPQDAATYLAAAAWMLLVAAWLQAAVLQTH